MPKKQEQMKWNRLSWIDWWAYRLKFNMANQINQFSNVKVYFKP